MGEIFDRTVAKVPLAWTGERLTDGAGPQVEIEHLHRYFLARSVCRGLDVLDVASGEGYGSAFIAQTALSVIGVELDPEVVAHACATYSAPNLRFLEGDARRLPVPDASVDIVVSFETIEHFYEHDEFLAEVRRVLRPGGRLVISSPERDVYSPIGAPPNPHHVRELTRAELLSLLRKNFANVVLQGQRPVLGSVLIAETHDVSSVRVPHLTFERRGPNRFEVSDGLARPVYLLAVASDAPIENVPESLYIDGGAIDETLVHLPQLRNQLDDANKELAKATEYARHVESELALRASELTDADQYARRLESELAVRDSRDAAANERLRQLETANEDRERLKEDRERLQADVRERDRSLAETKALLAESYRRTEVVKNEAGRQADRKQAELDEVVAYTRHVEANFAEASAGLANAEQYARTLEAEIARAHAERAALHEQHSAVIGSSAWRMTWPMRRAFDSHPGARRNLRRAAKLMWWTATLQLPRRIAARRAAPATPPASPATLPPPEPLGALPAFDETELAAEQAERSESSASQTEPLPPIAADVAPAADARELFTARARSELVDFLSSGERLVVPQTKQPDVSVVVILWNQAHLTLRCLRALLARPGLSLEIVLFDNGSHDQTADLLSRVDGVRVVRSETNEGFVVGCNRSVEVARGRVVLLLNSDAFVRPGALAAALAALDASEDVGAVGGRLILPSGQLQEAGSIMWSDASTLGYGRGLDPEAGEAMFRRDVDYCSGAFLMTPKALWEQLGGFEEAFSPAYYEEADYCMRLRDRGYRVVYEPRAVVDHYEFGSEDRQGEAIRLSRRNRKTFRTRHADALKRRHLPPAQANILAARQVADAGRRRLLVLDNELPLGALGSGYPRMRQLLIEAESLGWFVTFFPLHVLHVDWADARAEIPWEIEIASGRGVPSLGSFLEERQGYYDAILISRPDNMAIASDILRDRPHVLDGCRLIYDAEALFSMRDIARAAVEGLPPPDAEALLTAEVRLADHADAVLCVTEQEAHAFRSRLSLPVHVLSHPTEVAEDAPGFTARDGFLFVGRLLERDTPNWRGLAWFINECWPRIRVALPGTTLRVAGHLHPDHAELDAPGVELCGPVADLQPFYDSARLFVAPIRFAAGVPIKILEATAAGLPTAGTRLMALQLEWTPGVEIVAEDDPATLAAAIVELHGDKTRWADMRNAATQRLKLEHSAERFRTALASVLDGTSASPLPATSSRRVASDDRQHTQGVPVFDFQRQAALRTADEKVLETVGQGMDGAPHRYTATSSTEDDERAHRVDRVNEFWSGSNPVWSGEAMQWMPHPMVQERINTRASDHPNIDAYAHLKAFLTARGWTFPVARAASLCCGEGSLERELIKQGYARSVVGYDLAAGAIDNARRIAEAEGLTGVRYEVRDLERVGLSETGLDIVFALSGVHHLSQLEATFEAVGTALRPGGVFHVHEYVGPDRFQWTDRQLAEINTFLERLPARYRRLPDGSTKPLVTRPTIEEMLATDPSESVRSSMIEPLLATYFHIIDRRELGGTLLHMALSNIAQNFNPDVDEDRYWLLELFEQEDRLLREGAITSDFTVIIAERV